MREERFPWALGVILVLVIVGGIGFWLGSSSVAPVIVPVAAPVVPAPAPVTPVYPTYPSNGGGFPLFPLFFGLIFLFVVFKVIRHAAWSGYQRVGWSDGVPGGPAGPGGFRGPRGQHRGGRGWYASGWDVDQPRGQSRDVPPMVDEMFQRWHSRMHGGTSAQAQPDANATTAAERDDGSLDLPDAPPAPPSTRSPQA